MKRASRDVVLLAAWALIAGTRLALANDTAAELSIGGLQFTRSASVTMNSELLQISLTRVSVRYQFMNTGTAPVSLSVAFPLPDIALFCRNPFLKIVSELPPTPGR